VGYFGLAFDDRIQLQAGEKAAEGNSSFEDHHFASCDESPIYRFSSERPQTLYL
jgi:hypothetical protein